MAIPKLDEICDCCGGYDSLKILQLSDEKCFNIVEGDKTGAAFCLKDFAFLSQNHQCLDVSIKPGGRLNLFQVDAVFSPSSVLEDDTQYPRGIMILVKYPSDDINGEEIELKDKTVTLTIVDIEGNELTIPLHSLYTWFTNPVSGDPADLINSIAVNNPNTDFGVTLQVLVIFNPKIEE